MLKTLTAAAAVTALLCGAASARDQIRIVGSSTVFPFSATVAEQFGIRTNFATPIVEPSGTGGGFQEFCRGVGAETPDIANASRPIKASEMAMCLENGVDEIIEVPFGYDGIVVSNAKDAPEFSFTKRQLFQALAARIPTSDEDCTLIDNPNRTWADVDDTLPDVAIEVFGPPPTSGTRDAFVEIVMENGAKTYACLAELDDADGDAFKAVAHLLREDGAWIDAGENDNAIVNTLERTPSALGVAGFSFLDQNSDRIKGAVIDGVEPTFENIVSGDYGVSRSLFFYVKKEHTRTVPGLHQFATEFVSNSAAGELGYLVDKGLIPLTDEDRAEVFRAVRDLQVIDLEARIAAEHGGDEEPAALDDDAADDEAAPGEGG